MRCWLRFGLGLSAGNRLRSHRLILESCSQRHRRLLYGWGLYMHGLPVDNLVPSLRADSLARELVSGTREGYREKLQRVRLKITSMSTRTAMCVDALRDWSRSKLRSEFCFSI